MERLGARLGMAPGALWVKRDDATGLAGGGNKARKLEYLCADAIEQGCDTLVTGGGRQSNHVRMTAAAANRLGLACTIVLGADEPADADRQRGARPPARAGDRVGRRPRLLRDGGRHRGHVRAPAPTKGRRPYAMPIGGASAVGALGYVHAAHELLEQFDGELDWVVVADGSGGTHAGLLAGLPSHGAGPRRRRRHPSRPRRAGAGQGRRGRGAAPASPRPPAPCSSTTSASAPGYAVPTDDCRRALDLAARFEGLILDPVYTGKALAGLVHARREERHRPRRTRGVPAHRRPARAVRRVLRRLGQAGRAGSGLTARNDTIVSSPSRGSDVYALVARMSTKPAPSSTARSSSGSQ